MMYKMDIKDAKRLLRSAGYKIINENTSIRDEWWNSKVFDDVTNWLFSKSLEIIAQEHGEDVAREISDYYDKVGGFGDHFPSFNVEKAVQNAARSLYDQWDDEVAG